MLEINSILTTLLSFYGVHYWYLFSSSNSAHSFTIPVLSTIIMGVLEFFTHLVPAGDIVLSDTPSEVACVLFRMGGLVHRKLPNPATQCWGPYHHQAKRTWPGCHQEQGIICPTPRNTQGEWCHPKPPRIHASGPYQEQAQWPGDIHQRRRVLVTRWTMPRWCRGWVDRHKGAINLCGQHLQAITEQTRPMLVARLPSPSCVRRWFQQLAHGLRIQALHPR